MTKEVEELRTVFLLRFGHLPNGELYNRLRTNKEFREMYWFCDERLIKWYLRDHGRIWKK